MGRERTSRRLIAGVHDSKDGNARDHPPPAGSAACEDVKFAALLVDFDRPFCARLSSALALLGHSVTTVETSATCLNQLVSSSFDVLVVDLPSLGACAQIALRNVRRLAPDLAIVILTDCPHLETALIAVEIKVSAYLCKPVSVREVVDAIIVACRATETHLRRRALLTALSGAAAALQTTHPAPDATPGSATVQNGALILDREACRMWSTQFPNADHLELTEQETALMACLLTRPGDVFTPKYLARGITGQDLDQWQATSIVRPIVFRLRRKLLMSPHLCCSIRTARRAGYRLSIEETSGGQQNYWNELRAILDNSETELPRSQP